MKLFINPEIFDHAVLHSSVKWTTGVVSSLVEELKIACPNRTVTRSKWLEVSASRLSLSESQAYWSVFIAMKTVVLGQVGDWMDLSTVGILLLCQTFPYVRARTESFHRTEQFAQTLAVPNPTAPILSFGSSPTRQRGPIINLPRLLRDSAAVISFVQEILPHVLSMAYLKQTPDGEYDLTSEHIKKLRIILRGEGATIEDMVFIGESRVSSVIAADRISAKLSWDESLFPPFELCEPINQVFRTPESATSTLYISNQSRGAVFRLQQPDLTISDIYIVNCTETSIYVSEAIRNVSVVCCSDCDIYLMGVSGFCTLSNSDKVVIRAVTGNMRVENSTDCVGYIYTSRSVVLTGDTRGITLAPFNVLYSGHATIFQSGTGLHPDSSHATLWAQPICCTLTESPYTLLPPERFRLVSFPEAKLHSDLSLNVCIPQVYVDALREKQLSLESLRNAILTIPDEASIAKVNAVVSGHFREWLTNNQKTRIILDLVKQFQRTEQ
jgi:hypothetical protein